MSVKIILLVLIINIITCPKFDQFEIDSCKNITPTSKKSCLSYNSTTLVCCYFEMIGPAKGNLCIPFPLSSSEQEYNDVNRTAFGTIHFKGNLTCRLSSQIISVKLLSLILYIILIL